MEARKGQFSGEMEEAAVALVFPCMEIDFIDYCSFPVKVHISCFTPTHQYLSYAHLKVCIMNLLNGNRALKFALEFLLF